MDWVILFKKSYINRTITKIRRIKVDLIKGVKNKIRTTNKKFIQLITNQIME